MKKKEVKKTKLKKPVKPKPEGYVFGRPTKYRPEYCEMLIKHMKKGYSFKTFAATIGVMESTIELWAHEYDDFSVAKKTGKVFEKAVWEKIIMRCAETGRGNPTAIIWATKNKFPDDYKERNEAQQINVQANVNNIQVSAWNKGNDERLQLLEEKERQISQLKAINAPKSKK